VGRKDVASQETEKYLVRDFPSFLWCWEVNLNLEEVRITGTLWSIGWWLSWRYLKEA